MVKHIVCFKLKDNSEQNVQKAVEVLKSMEGKVPQIKEIFVGADFLHSERSYDVFLEVVVESRKALEEYQCDEYHCTVVKPHMHAVRESSVAVDIEF